MPGCVVDFGYGKKKGQPEKLHLLFVNIYLHFVDPMIKYRYVARHGCLPMWFHQQFRWTGIETILFFIMPRLGTCLAWWMLCAWYPEQFPGSRIEIIAFRVTENEWVRFLIFPTRFLFSVFYIFLCVRIRFLVPLQKIPV